MSQDLTIAYQGPFLDYSGYGEANRQALRAFDSAGVNINGKIVKYTKSQAEYGDVSSLIKRCIDNENDYDIKIMHVTPDEIPRLIEIEKYSIAHFFWETDRVPDIFIDGLNYVNEIWTGSKANEFAIKNSGVDTPVFIFPQATNTDLIKTSPFHIDFDGFLFYSIFEWTDRKNPEALVRAYSKTFNSNDNVGLLIKTYIGDFSERSKQTILSKLKDIRSLFDDTAKIFFHHELMSYEEIHGLHERGDCFVSAHRGEGWGVPQAEAICHGNPVITTGYGGINEYFTDMKDGIVVPYSLVPIHGMEHARHYYQLDQNWAEIDEDYLASRMRFVFENQGNARKIGKAGKNLAMSKFSYEVVGNQMKNRILEIIGDQS
jgi:glycosyltransferase involved in cell wall biosynthesis